MLLDELHAQGSIGTAFHFGILDARLGSADEAALAFNLRPLGIGWRAISREASREVLEDILAQDFVFGRCRLAQEDTVRATNEFLEAFPEEALFFTNGVWIANANGHRQLSEWSPATDATFDSGILVLAPGQIGVVWVEDED